MVQRFLPGVRRVAALAALVLPVAAPQPAHAATAASLTLPSTAR